MQISTTRNTERLLKQIERYFDCLLSDEEEAQLRRELSVTDIAHPVIDEAKALMGFRTIKLADASGSDPAKSSDTALPFRPTLLRIAAAAMIVLALGAALKLAFPAPEPSECIAYANGHSLTDEDAVMQLMIENLTVLEEGVNEVREDVIEELGVLYTDPECDDEKMIN